LYKLNHYGIRDHSLKWFESYLSDRRQFTYINNNQSNLKPIKYGVPQGSVLGPLLFLIYTNDIVNSTSQDCKTRLFADDTNGFVTADSPTQLKHLISSFLADIFSWCSENKLTVNLDKTCYTIFKNKNKIIPDTLNNIKLTGAQISRVPSAKYLGITLDENLSWEEHITNINKSLIKTSNSFKIIKRRVHEENKATLYYAYIYSRIQYGIEVYGRADSTVIKKVQTQQNRSLKILYDKDYYTPTTTLHKELNLLLVKDIYNLNIAKFVYKQKHDLLPEIFTNLFTENNQIHKYKTRQTNNIHQKHPVNKFGKLTTDYQGANIWNNIPNSIRTLKTVKTFSKKLKRTYINTY